MECSSMQAAVHDTSVYPFTIECPVGLEVRGYDVKKTHDHPWLKNHLPEELRQRRRLTKIEGGIPKKNDALTPPFQPVFATLVEPYLYQISLFSHLHLRGDLLSIRKLLLRIQSLSHSILGATFLQSLQEKGVNFTLSLHTWKNIEQVIVSCPPDIDEKEIEKTFPLEWTTCKSWLECKRILNEIQSGSGAIVIDEKHPQEEEIIAMIAELAMRPSGAQLLRSIDGFRKKEIVKICYEKGENDCLSLLEGDKVFSIIHLDLEASGTHKSSLHKTQEIYINNIPKWPQGTVAHELIHALHYFLREFEQEKTISLETLLDGAIFSETEGKYQLEYDSMQLYTRHTNYDEQRTILGVPGDPNSSTPTENSVRYEWFQYLRIEHVKSPNVYNRPFFLQMIQQHPLRYEDFTLDDLQVAIHKTDEVAIVYFLTRMTRQEVETSLLFLLRKIEKLQLAKRMTIYAVIQAGIMSKKLLSTFPIRQLVYLVFSKMEEEDVQKITALLPKRCANNTLRKAQKYLKSLYRQAIFYGLVREKCVLHKYLQAIPMSGLLKK